MKNLILEITQGICEVKSSVPSSLNEAMKKGLNSYGFSDEVDKLISDYWNNGGKFIRSIRDINEHHGTLVDQTFFEFKNEPRLLDDNYPGRSSDNYLGRLMRYKSDMYFQQGMTHVWGKNNRSANQDIYERKKFRQDSNPSGGESEFVRTHRSSN